MQLIKSTVTLRLAGSTEIPLAGSILATFFTKRTVVAEPLSDELDEEVKTNMLTRRNEILSLVKDKVDKVLNPNKPPYNTTKSEKEILSSLGITEERYYWALSVSHDSDFDLHLKRPLDSCFINNFFLAGVKGFRANVDLQPIFNHYQCVTMFAHTLQKMKPSVRMLF